MSYAPNGDVLAANDSANGNWTYQYDDFNRLVKSVPSGQTYWYTYDYDRLGNRWHQSLNGTGGPPGNTSSLSFSGSNNRIDTYSYDAAGNLLNDGTHSYTYDAENRIVCVDSGTAIYVYDANGQRVRKTTGASSCTSTTSGTKVDYLYDLEGHQVSEVSATGAWNRGEVYVGGRHLATYSGGASGATYFIHADWLGTERARSTVAGAVCETMTSLPFGDGLATSGSCGDPSPLHFTGKQHDAETNLDDFDARYYSSGLARFMIPDWAAKATAVPYAEFGDPQSLNLYSYVRNNPVTSVDADGHEPGKDPGKGAPPPVPPPPQQSTPAQDPQPIVQSHGQSAEPNAQKQSADRKEWQAAVQKREEQVRGQQNAPKPGTPEYAQAVLTQAGAEASAGVKYGVIAMAGLAVATATGVAVAPAAAAGTEFVTEVAAAHPIATMQLAQGFAAGASPGPTPPPPTVPGAVGYAIGKIVFHLSGGSRR
jgi:RHS repeat-associated protein